jgi:endoglucanase
VSETANGDRATPELLERLLAAPSPSGYEGPAAALWREAASFARLRTDGIGSSIAEIGEEGTEPLLAVVGHIDEIGLLVTHIDEKGSVLRSDRGLGPAT